METGSEGLTALVEHADGRLEIVDWSRQPASTSEPGAARLQAKLS
jgi:hypothetical protein